MTTSQHLPLRSLGEESVKSALLVTLVGHAVKSAIDSHQSIISLLVNIIIATISVYALVLELNFLIFHRPKLPPGSLGLPIVGDLLEVIFRYKGGLLPLLYNKSKLYGPIFLNSILGRTLVTLGDSDSLTWLWNNDRKSLTESSWSPNIAALLGPTAVANLQGRYHKVVRRLMEPFYTPLFVANYTQIMVDTTDEDLEEWSKTNDFVSGEEFKLYALRLFMISSFGQVDNGTIMTLHDDYKEWISGFLTFTGTLRIGKFDRAMKARDRIMETINDLVKKFMSENPEDSDRAKKTIMGRMIYTKDENGVGLTMDEINDNLLNLIFAGHDTTFASINTVLHHISQHPHVRDALIEEVSKFKEPLDPEEMKNAPVLNAIMHESWRVDPPVGFAFRKSVKKELEYKNWLFPQGTTFAYNISLTAHQEDLYSSPQAFQMERFLPRDHPLADPNWECNVDPNQGKATYPIFGGGTHVCLGQHFARLELRIIMARMFKQYDVEVRNSTKIFMPVNGWYVDFKLTKKES